LLVVNASPGQLIRRAAAESPLALQSREEAAEERRSAAHSLELDGERLSLEKQLHAIEHRTDQHALSLLRRTANLDAWASCIHRAHLVLLSLQRDDAELAWKAQRERTLDRVVEQLDDAPRRATSSTPSSDSLRDERRERERRRTPPQPQPPGPRRPPQPLAPLLTIMPAPPTPLRMLPLANRLLWFEPGRFQRFEQSERTNKEISRRNFETSWKDQEASKQRELNAKS